MYNQITHHLRVFGNGSPLYYLVRISIWLWLMYLDNHITCHKWFRLKCVWCTSPKPAKKWVYLCIISFYIWKRIRTSHQRGISSSILSVFFTDKFYKLLKSLHLIGWEQICQWKSLTKRLMKCPPGQFPTVQVLVLQSCQLIRIFRIWYGNQYFWSAQCQVLITLQLCLRAAT